MTLLPSCKSASNVPVIQIDATGVVYGTAFVDENGNGVQDAADLPLKGADVLLTSGSAGLVQQVTTDSAGNYRMLDVPAGSYGLALSSSLLGDSLSAVGDSVQGVTLQRGDTTRVDLGVSFSFVPLSQVRALPAGEEIFTSGIALNPNLSFGDSRLHVQSDTTYLRAINVARGTVNTGDSVRLKGRTAVDNGEPVLDQVTPFLLVSAARVPLPVDVGTGEAVTAGGGGLDAALVRARNAEILDTATVNGDFHFHVDDGSGVVDVVLPYFLQLSTSSIFPDSIVRVSQVTGLLVPQVDGTGQVQWHIVPRGAGDLVLQVKQADVGLGLAVDKPTAASGDTVTLTVVVTNAGPLAASGVQVLDTIPAGLTLLGTSATKGAYDGATSTWTVDSVSVGGQDTLKLVAQVTAPSGSTLVDRAYIVRLRREVDGNLSNNAGAVGIGVTAVPAPVAFGYPPILMPTRTTLPADGTRTLPNPGLTFVGRLTTPFPLRSMGLEGSTSSSALSTRPD